MREKKNFYLLVLRGIVNDRDEDIFEFLLILGGGDFGLSISIRSVQPVR